MRQFTSHTLDEHTQSLANFLPGGCVFANKNIPNTVHHSLLRGLAGELKRVEATLLEWLKQYDPRTTTDFITNWERVVGIPDGCFTGTESLETRRKHIVAKFLARGVATEQDFIDLAKFLGYDISFERLPGVDNFFPYNIPLSFVTGLPRSRFVLIIIGQGLVPCVPPYAVPFIPGCNDKDSPLICFFNKLKPANTVIIYRNTPVEVTRVTEEGDLRLTGDGSDFRIIAGT